MVFKIPGPWERVIRDEGFDLDVALFPNMFSYGLKLPFPRTLSTSPERLEDPDVLLLSMVARIVEVKLRAC